MQNTGTQSDKPSDRLIEIDINCPACDYNLRGLFGPVVDCPECGLTIGVPKLAAMRCGTSLGLKHPDTTNLIDLTQPRRPRRVPP